MSTNRSNRVWNHLKHFVALAIVALLIGPLMSAGPPEVDLTFRYLLLATSRTKTMQKELDEAAGAGYRIITGSPTSGSEMALILEKIAAAAGRLPIRTSCNVQDVDDAKGAG